MSEFIIIAGPQAAGKSTVISRLNEQYQNISPLFPRKKTPLLFPLQESRQIIVHANILLGAIFMTRQHELEVVKCDLLRMDQILRRTRDRLVYLDECNIFTIAHAAAHGIEEIEKHWNEYVVRLKKLRAKVIFLDIPPEVSWERRRKKYEQRLVYFPKKSHKGIMKRYEEYMEKAHILLHDVFRRVPFPKEIIDGRLPEKAVIQRVGEILANL